MDAEPSRGLLMAKGAMDAGRWGRLVRTASFRQLEPPALAARLPAGMVALLLVLVTTAHHGSYTAAGVVTACYGVGLGAGAPLGGRLVDRLGARPVLLVAGCGRAAAFITFLLASVEGWPLAGRSALAAAAGLLAPPVGAIMRTLWRAVLPEAEIRDTAFALESVLIDVVYVLGPLLVTAAVAAGSADIGLVVAAALVLAGSLGLTAAPATRHVGGTKRRAAGDWKGPLGVPGVRRLVPVALLTFGALEAVDFGAVAAARDHGVAWAAGALVAGLSIGSIAGGLYWGSRTQPGSSRSQLVVLAGGLTVGLAAVSAVPGLVGVGVILAVAGTTVAPLITVQFAWVAQVTPGRYLTEAFTWVSAASAAGSAIAGAVSGYTVHRVGASGAFLVAAAMTVLATALAARLTARREPAQPVQP